MNKIDKLNDKLNIIIRQLGSIYGILEKDKSVDDLKLSANSITSSENLLNKIQSEFEMIDARLKLLEKREISFFNLSKNVNDLMSSKDITKQKLTAINTKLELLEGGIITEDTINSLEESINKLEKAYRSLFEKVKQYEKDFSETLNAEINKLKYDISNIEIRINSFQKIKDYDDIDDIYPNIP